jgi:hypothetical protein
MTQAPERVEVYRREDSLSTAVKILAPQLGTDAEQLAEFVVDPRRMTRLNKIELTAVAYFLPDHPAKGENADWLGKFIDGYMNLKMSEEGHERAVLLVEALKAIGGVPKPEQKKTDDRNWHQRNLTMRNKGPDK